MANLNDVLLYLECPRKFSFAKANVEKSLSDNDKMKKRVKEVVLRTLKENLDITKFVDEIGAVGKVKTDVLYKLIQDNKDKILDENKILVVALKTPTDGYEKSLFYNIHQVIEKGNKELHFNVIVLNVTPKLEEVTLKPRSPEQINEINLLMKSVERVINVVEKEQLVYLKRPNTISCNACVYNAECKPLCFTREVKDE